MFEQSDISGRLLILGDPGAGKTTTLLDLAKGLVERAIADSAAPIPVIFALSAWKDPKQEMKDWLIAELKSKYGVRIDISKKWIEDKQLLPLLDGLDEVKPEHQQSCVTAINRLLGSDDRPSDLVVCSRREEYETYQTKLQLNGAICLTGLTNEQIQDYLRRANRFELWQMLQDDAALLELVRKPLFLSITVLSYGAIALEQWQRSTSTELRLKLLFDVYWEAMITRDLVEPRLSEQGIQSRAYGRTKPPSRAQTRQWLIYLTQQLQEESETEFLVEEIQPQVLSKKLHQWQYWLLLFSIATFLTGTIAAIGFLVYLDELNSLAITNGVVVFGLFGGFVLATESKSDGVRLITYPLVVLCCWLFKNELPSEYKEYMPIIHRINFSRKLHIGIPSLRQIRKEFIYPLRYQSFVSSNFFLFPLTPFIYAIHTLLGSMVYSMGAKRLGLKLKRSARYVGLKSLVATRGLESSRYSHYGFTIFLTIQYVKLLRLKGGWFLNTVFNLIGVLFTTFLWLLFTPISLISLFFSNQIEEIRTPNQGLYEGLKIALFCMLIQISYIFSILYFRVVPTISIKATSLILGFVLSLTLLPLIKHLSLRVILLCNGDAPWDYARFLNYATERLFLQRVGGRYRFIHKLLQEHFAGMRDEG
ncbi:NACHT domain-containing protein [Phormidesmis sp. 146-33]